MNIDYEELLTMKTLSERSGLTQRTIHLHEERGFISSIRKSDTGNRYFTEDTLMKLQKITQLQAIGLSIKEISEVWPLYMDSTDHGVKGKQKALTILQGHLVEADEKLEQVRELRESIIKSIARMELLLEQYQTLNDESNSE